MPDTQAKTPESPKPQPVASKTPEGAHPMSDPPKMRDRPDPKPMDEFFGGQAPAKKQVDPIPKPPEKTQDEPFPPKEQDAEQVSKTETAKPDDLDAVINSVRPHKAKAEDKKESGQAPPTEQQFTGPRELREAYNRSKGEVESLKKQLEGLKSESERVKEYTEAIEALKKERDDLAQKLEFADFRESPTFAERYTKPLQKATERAVELVSKFKHQMEERAGKPEDIYSIYQTYIQDPAAAASRAEESFGAAAAALIMRRVEDIASLESESRVALDDWKKNGNGRKALIEAEQTKLRQFAVETFNKQLELEEGAFSDMFGLGEDKELGELYKKVKPLVNTAFMPDGNMSPEQLYRHSAKVAAMAAALPVSLAKVAKLEKEIAELKSSLDEYEDAKPRIRSSGTSERGAQKKVGIDALDSYFNQ